MHDDDLFLVPFLKSKSKSLLIFKYRTLRLSNQQPRTNKLSEKKNNMSNCLKNKVEGKK